MLLAAGAGAVLDAPYGHAADRAELARVAPGVEADRMPRVAGSGCGTPARPRDSGPLASRSFGARQN